MWYLGDDMHSTTANAAQAMELPSISSCAHGWCLSSLSLLGSLEKYTYVDQLEQSGRFDVGIAALDLLASLVESLLDHL